MARVTFDNNTTQMSLLPLASLAGDTAPLLAPEQSVSAYASMLLIRRFEEKLGQLVALGLIESTAKLTTCRETIPVAIAMALRPDEAFVTSASPYGALLARGVEPAELCARVLSGASMTQDLKESGVTVAQDALDAVQTAEQLSLRPSLACCWIDYSSVQSAELMTWWEAAVRRRLPVVAVVSTTGTISASAADLGALTTHLRHPGAHVETVEAVDFGRTHSACWLAMDRVRRGEGPALILARSIAFQGHAAAVRLVRAKAPAREDVDPLARMRASLLEDRMCTEAELKIREKDVRDRISGAVAAAKGEMRAD